MNEHGSGYRETARKYGLVTQSMVGAIYTLIVGNAYTLKKEPKALWKNDVSEVQKQAPEKKPLPPEVKQNFITKVQQLRERNECLEMENEYLKKSNVLVQAEEQKNGKSPNSVWAKAKVSV